MILSFGFYAVLWGKAKEEELTVVDFDDIRPPSNTKSPLLQSYKVKDELKITKIFNYIVILFEIPKKTKHCDIFYF